jgi:hypothetical protein
MGRSSPRVATRLVLLMGLLKKAAVPAPELPAFVAEATSAE